MEEDACLSFVFDNSHAWYQSKTVTCWIEVGSDADVPPPVDLAATFGANAAILGPTEKKLARLLVAEGRSDLFASWPAPSTDSDVLKHAFFRKCYGIEKGHPGGLAAWVQAGKALPDLVPASGDAKPPAAAPAVPPAAPGVPLDLV
jgi:hypothetical protein